MKILVLNCGSQSVKFQVVETSTQQAAANADRTLAKGAIDRVGSPQASSSFEAGGHEPAHHPVQAADHREALQIAFGLLAGAGIGAAEIDGVGHRVVHGGERFTRSVRMDAGVEREIEACTALAPLHNPHNLKGYHAARELAPNALHVAVFDTAFHQTMPASAYLYGLPYSLYSEHHIRRYGFHGTAHRYLSYRFAEIHGKPESAFKLITCHLGNGCSVCAIAGGTSIDTSMGLTPLEGLLMGTRGGDLDPGVLLHLLSAGLMTPEDLPDLLNARSGLLGLSGVSNDMRDVDAAASEGNERARAAIDVFCHRVRKYIGAYYALLNGADAIVFSAGIGENSPEVRSRICRDLEALGVILDDQKNQACRGTEADVSAAGSRTRVWVIPADEELMIARETLDLLVVG